jgi:hypothetical protein
VISPIIIRGMAITFSEKKFKINIKI